MQSIVPWFSFWVAAMRGAVSYLNLFYRALSATVAAHLLLITHPSRKGILLVYLAKSHDQLTGARAANRERRVMVVGTPFKQSLIRLTLTAVAVASSGRWGLLKPR